MDIDRVNSQVVLRTLVSFPFLGSWENEKLNWNNLQILFMIQEEFLSNQAEAKIQNPCQ